MKRRKDAPPMNPHFPENPGDLGDPPPYPEPIPLPGKPKDGDKDGTPLKAGVMMLNSREATDEDLKQQQIGTPLKGHVALTIFKQQRGKR